LGLKTHPKDTELASHPFVRVSNKVDYDQNAPRLNDARHLADDVGWVRNVMEDHMGERCIHPIGRDGDLVGFPLSQFDGAPDGCSLSGQIAFGGFEHSSRVVNANHSKSELGQFAGQDARSRSDIRDPEASGNQSRNRSGAKRVIVEDFPQRVPFGSDRIEKISAFLAARQNELPENCVVPLGSGVSFEAPSNQGPAIAPWAFSGRREAIENVGPIPAVLEKSCLAKNREVTRDPGLGHGQDFHDFLNDQLLTFEDPKDSHARGVREDLEDSLEFIRCTGRRHH
jgi:hypothetical protein